MRNHLFSGVDGRRQMVMKQNKGTMRRESELSDEITTMEDNIVYWLHSHFQEVRHQNIDRRRLNWIITNRPF